MKLGVYQDSLDSFFATFCNSYNYIPKEKSALKDCKYHSAPSQTHKQTYNEINWEKTSRLSSFGGTELLSDKPP